MNNPFISFKSRAEEVEFQRQALNFNLLSQRPADVERLHLYADTVYQLVIDRVERINPIPYIFDVVQGEPGKKIKIKESWGGEVFERSYGEYKRKTRIERDWHEMSTSPKSVHFETAAEDLKTGVVTTTELAQMAADAIVHHKIKMAWKVLKDAVPTTDATYSTDTSGDLIYSDLDTEIKDLDDKYEIGLILGRRSFLFPIVTFTGYDNSSGYPEEVKRELHQRGMLDRYRGIPILGLREHKNELTGKVACDAGNIFILAANKGWNRFVEVAPVTPTLKTEPEDGTIHFIYDYEDGAAVWKPQFIRRLYNSSATGYL